MFFFTPPVLKPTFLAGNVTASTLHNMRELQQSTVNNVVRPVSNATEKAIHKIGDLQVRNSHNCIITVKLSWHYVLLVKVVFL